MKTLTIKNDFHQTETKVRAELLNHGMHFETTLSSRQMQRVKKTLCGQKDCTCGGIRGKQLFEGKKLVINLFTKEQLHLVLLQLNLP